MNPVKPSRLPVIVIVGAGFGGLSVAKKLKNIPARVIIVDRKNHHLFQPLLYQVATSALDGSDIAGPIRHIFRRSKNTNVILGEVIGIDPKSQSVAFRDRSLSYDYLVLATGSRVSYFGNDQWEKLAPGLKSVSDALNIRTRILSAFEKAEWEGDPNQRRRLMTIVLIGGGPTGVELAGSLAELLGRTLSGEFRNIDPRTARVILIEAGPRILNAFPESLASLAKQDLESVGVEVKVDSKVKNIDEKGVHLNDEIISAETILWTAGVEASRLFYDLDVDRDRSGRIKVLGDLSIPGYRNIFVIGDLAYINGKNGRPLPAVAPVAIQQGSYIAKILKAKFRKGDSDALPSFQYVDKGNMATIGKSTAIVDIKGFRFDGFFGWFVWAIVHIYYLINFRSRFMVMLKWSFLYLTFQRPERLIITSEALTPAPKVSPRERKAG